MFKTSDAKLAEAFVKAIGTSSKCYFSNMLGTREVDALVGR